MFASRILDLVPGAPGSTKRMIGGGKKSSTSSMMMSFDVGCTVGEIGEPPSCAVVVTAVESDCHTWNIVCENTPKNPEVIILANVILGPRSDLRFDALNALQNSPN